jgi:hypothetical protein
MANTEATAARWVAILAQRAELPFAAELPAHFSHARITRLCDCGCNSFDCTVPPEASLRPLFGTGRDLPSFEVAFAGDGGDPIDVIVYADERGHLSGIDVHLGLSNHAPMPLNATIGQVLYTIPDQ